MSNRIGADVVRLLARLGVSEHGYHELARARRAAAAAAAWSVLASTDRALAARRRAGTAPVEAPAAVRVPAAVPAAAARPASAPSRGGYALLAPLAPLSVPRLRSGEADG